MPKQIRPGLYRLEVPLTGSPLKALNSYIITSSDRNLIVDTGFNRPECLAAMKAGLAELAVDLTRTDIFLTHLHADHTGLISALKTDTSHLYTAAIDAHLVSDLAHRGPDDPLFADITACAIDNGFPPAEARNAIANHPGLQYGPTGQLTFTVLEDGQNLAVGGYSFTCLATPGHTGSHMCLYEPTHKLLIAGDHILGDITPNISIMEPAGNPLADYLVSLTRVDTLDVDLVLPGHRRVFSHCRRRIAELIAHHHRRAGEAVAILAAGPLTAYQVAAGMTWDLSYRTFAEFPAPQKWFAVGEALAHLRYLEGEGRINRCEQGGLTHYRLV